MPNTLFIRPTKINQLDEAAFEWALYDVAGVQLKYGSNAALDMIDQTLMQNGIENVEIVGFWPANAAFSSHVSLPGNQTRFIKQALPFAVEEQVAQDIEQIHISLGAKTQKGDYSVINVDRSLFSSFFDLLNADLNELPLKGIYVDADSLPLEGEDLSLCLSKDSVLIKDKLLRLIALKPDNLISYLDSLFLGQVDEPSEDVFEIKLRVAADYLDQSKMLIAQIEQYPNISLHVEEFGVTELELLCDNYFHNKQIPVNLCQDDFQVARQSGGSWQRWRSVAVIAGIGFLLQLGVFVGQGMYLNEQSQHVGERALSSYKKMVPNSSRVSLAKLPRIIKGKLNQKNAGGATEMDFLDLLGEAGYYFNRSQFKQTLRFKSINFNQQRGELILDMQAQSFDQLESLKQAITSAGLSAKIGSAVQEKQFWRGRISVSGA
jgi:general secretion pathway protein L